MKKFVALIGLLLCFTFTVTASTVPDDVSDEITTVIAVDNLEILALDVPAILVSFEKQDLQALTTTLNINKEALSLSELSNNGLLRIYPLAPLNLDVDIIKLE